METWVLMFYLSMGRSFDGGQFQTEEDCRKAAVYQLETRWRDIYGYRIGWRCEQRINHD